MPPLIHGWLRDLKVDLMGLTARMRDMQLVLETQARGARNMTHELDEAFKYNPPINPYDGVEEVRPCSHLFNEVCQEAVGLEAELRAFVSALRGLEEQLDKKGNDGQD